MHFIQHKQYNETNATPMQF